MYKVRTVDVWDTLLRRRCHPETIKQMTARNLWIEHASSLKDSCSSIRSIYGIRLEIEQRLAKSSLAEGFDDEYHIRDVFQLWLSEVVSDVVFNQWSEEDTRGFVTSLIDTELDHEIDQTYIDPDILGFLDNYPAEKTFFLSDFYMDAALIKRLLIHHGLDKVVVDGYASCDLRRNKRSGALFQFIQQQHAIRPEEHVHIGDNRFVDVEVPSRLGIQSVHFLPVDSSQHKKRVELESQFSDPRHLFSHLEQIALSEAPPKRQETSLDATSLATILKDEQCSTDLPSFLSYTQKVHADYEEAQQAIFRLGISSAPLFIGFAIFCEERRISDQLDKLCFLTREGEFFQKVYSELFCSGKMDGNLFGRDSEDDSAVKSGETLLLEVSRLATVGASFDASDLIKSFMQIWDVHRLQSVQGIFSTLGLKVTEFSKLLEDLRLKSDEVVHQPQEDPRIVALLSSKDFVDAASISISHLRQGLSGYLSMKLQAPTDTQASDNIAEDASDKVATGSRRVGVVDIGWSGSIQDNISKVWTSSTWYGYYMAMSIWQQEGSLDSLESLGGWCGGASGMGGDGCRGPSRGTKREYLLRRGPKTRKFFDGMHILEMLCSSKGGSVVGYERLLNTEESMGSINTKHRELYRALRATNCEEEQFFTQIAEPFQRGVIHAAGVWRVALRHNVIVSEDLVTAGKQIWMNLIEKPLPELVRGILSTPQHDGLIFGDYFKRANAPKLGLYLRALISSKARSELKSFVRRFQWSESVAYLKELTVLERTALQILLVGLKVGQRIKLRFI